MKFYETNYDEYLCSYEKYNIYPELNKVKDLLPKSQNAFKNIILYGPSGVGKYTQMLSILQNYSPSKLKYDKRIGITYEKQEKKTTKPTTAPIEKTKSSTYIKKKTNGNANIQIKKQDKKHEYTYRISDIHYEIDMATLGCNSKLVWHELFFQIVDIISVSPDKIGIIVCKNFHLIHNELLDILYSYMRHPFQHMNIHIKFILLTEHIGFIPENVLNICSIIPVKRPTKDHYLELSKHQKKAFSCFTDTLRNGIMYDKTNRTVIFHKNKTEELLEEIPIQCITNAKEIHSFAWLKSTSEIPVDVFNIICDNILNLVLFPKHLKIVDLRNHLYDLLIYNVDISEYIWYIMNTLIHRGLFRGKEDITDIINQIFIFLKYYNNNYRSIYHLESITLSIINKINYA